MNKFESLSEAIEAWADKHHFDNRFAFQLIYAAFMTSPEFFQLFRELMKVSTLTFKDWEDNFLSGYDMDMIDFELDKIAEEIYDQSGEDWTVVNLEIRMKNFRNI